MPKFYAIEEKNGVTLTGTRDDGTLPDGTLAVLPPNAVEITKENYNYAKQNITHALNRKIVAGEVVARTDQEKEVVWTTEKYSPEKARAMYRLGRTSYRLTRHPFVYKGNSIKLEEGDLRATPYSIFSTWDNFIRDAVLAELTGKSILPIKVLDIANLPVDINTPDDLYDLHAAMVTANKKVLEDEITVKQALNATVTYSEIKDVRDLNSARTK